MNRVAPFQLSDLQFRTLIPHAFCGGGAVLARARRRRFGRAELRPRFFERMLKLSTGRRARPNTPVIV